MQLLGIHSNAVYIGKLATNSYVPSYHAIDKFYTPIPTESVVFLSPVWISLPPIPPVI